MAHARTHTHTCAHTGLSSHAHIHVPTHTQASPGPDFPHLASAAGGRLQRHTGERPADRRVTLGAMALVTSPSGRHAPAPCCRPGCEASRVDRNKPVRWAEPRTSSHCRALLFGAKPESCSQRRALETDPGLGLACSEQLTVVPWAPVPVWDCGSPRPRGKLVPSPWRPGSSSPQSKRAQPHSPKQTSVSFAVTRHHGPSWTEFTLLKALTSGQTVGPWRFRCHPHANLWEPRAPDALGLQSLESGSPIFLPVPLSSEAGSPRRKECCASKCPSLFPLL